MLQSLITSKARRKALSLFMANPQSQFYLREAARRTGEPTNAISFELARLESAGILVSERKGNLLFYKANQNCPIYAELKAIVLKTEGIGDALREALKSEPGLKFAFIYGSYAKGTERQGSDIDVMLVGDAKPEKISMLFRSLEKSLGREINCTIYPEAEFAKGKGFIKSVLKDRKVMLVGDKDELERFAA